MPKENSSDSTVEIGFDLRSLWDFATSIFQYRQIRSRLLFQEVWDLHPCDLERLSQFFVIPDVSSMNPADGNADVTNRPRLPVDRMLCRFIAEPPQRVTGSTGENVLFLLSDAGMGKSSTLTMIRAKQLQTVKIPWRLDLRAHKLKSSTLEWVSKIESPPGRTILLLDALDEDPLAHGRVFERMSELIRACHRFYKVIITCRTQFLPDLETVDIGGRLCFSISGFWPRFEYLQPFTDAQVQDFITRRYPSDPDARDRLWRFVQHIQDLKFRPLLLSFAEEIVKNKLEMRSKVQLFDSLARLWIERERQRLCEISAGSKAGPSHKSHTLPGEISFEALLDACMEVAVALQREGNREISIWKVRDALIGSTSAMSNLLAEHFFEAMDYGSKSLMNKSSSGNLRFSHYLFQEFFASRRIWHSRKDGINSSFGVILTDMIVVFLREWRRITPSSGDQFPHIDLTKSIGKGLQLKEQELVHFHFSGAKLDDANFSGSNLQYSRFRDASARNADFSDADLTGVDFSATDLTNAELVGAKLDYAILSQASLRNAHLCSALMSGSPTESMFLSNYEDRTFRVSLRVNDKPKPVACRGVSDSYAVFVAFNGELRMVNGSAKAFDSASAEIELFSIRRTCKNHKDAGIIGEFSLYSRRGTWQPSNVVRTIYLTTTKGSWVASAAAEQFAVCSIDGSHGNLSVKIIVDNSLSVEIYCEPGSSLLEGARFNQQSTFPQSWLDECHDMTPCSCGASSDRAVTGQWEATKT